MVKQLIQIKRNHYPTSSNGRSAAFDRILFDLLEIGRCSVPSLPPPSVGAGAGVAGFGTSAASKSLTFTNNYEAKSELKI